MKLSTCEREGSVRIASQRTKLWRSEGKGGEGGKPTKGEKHKRRMRVKKHTVGL